MSIDIHFIQNKTKISPIFYWIKYNFILFNFYFSFGRNTYLDIFRDECYMLACARLMRARKCVLYSYICLTFIFIYRYTTFNIAAGLRAIIIYFTNTSHIIHNRARHTFSNPKVTLSTILLNVLFSAFSCIV